MRYILVVMALWLNLYSSAQLNGKYSFTHLNQADGLLHTSIRGIGQDRNGFIWILSLNGLQRYDGSRFVNYTSIADPATGMMHSSELYMDTALNQIWVMKGPTMQRLDLRTEKISTVSIEDAFKEDSLHQPEIFTELSGNYARVNLKGVLWYEKDTNKKIGGYFNLNDQQPYHQGYISKDSSTGDYWMHNYNSMFIADAKTKIIHSSMESHSGFPLLDQFYKINSTPIKIRYLSTDSFGNLWIATWDHILFRYHLDTKKLYTYSLKNIKNREVANENADLTLLINAIYEDRQKNLWLGTEYAGLLKYDREKDDFDFITSDDKISNGIRYNFTIYSIFQDRDDNIWLGTDRGISIFNPYRNYFQSIRHIDDHSRSIPGQDITSVVETQQGEILVSTWGGGISVFDRHWNFIRNIHFKESNEYNLIWSNVQDDDGHIWFGAQQGYIHQYDPEKHSFSTIHPAETGFSTISIMAKDHKGNILLGLRDGKITVWNKKENKFYPYGDAADKHNIQLPFITYIFTDHRNVCWVATHSGLMKFDIDHHVYLNSYRPDIGDSTVNIILEGIGEYNDSTLMVGTKNKGIYFFNTISGKFSRMFEDEKVNSSSVYAIKKDGKGNVWFASDYHIYEWNEELKKPIQYNISQSTINADFISNEFYSLLDGRWVAFTSAEVICFDPGQLEVEGRKQYHVAISGVKIFDKKIDKEFTKAMNEPLILPYNENFISIEFASLDFLNVTQKNYNYRLSGINPDWIQSDNKSFADYTDLHPGNYVFEVRAGINEKDSPVTSIPIVVLSPWWGTFWFRILCALAVVSFIFLLVRRRIFTIRKEAELRHRIAESEVMALRSQMNPHFIFNCINGIDAMIQSNDKYKATVYLNKFAKLIRNVLDSSQQNKVHLSKDMETLRLYIDLELFRHQDSFKVSIETDPELIQNDYKVPPLIIQPYVENAILHGLRHLKDREGKLNITVSKTEDHIEYTIEDNGVGRKYLNGDMNKNDRGYGMQMSSDRIRLFNDERVASVQVEDLRINGEPSGTRIYIQLKI